MIAYVALGANLGDVRETFSAALEKIKALPQTDVTKVSSYYRTKPVEADGPMFTNAVCEIKTTLPSETLLKELQRIEDDLGRVRPEGVVNAPRTLDLDLLTYGFEVIATENLTVPHPRMAKRAFVLVPLSEIAPNLMLANFGCVSDLVKQVQDQFVEKL